MAPLTLDDLLPLSEYASRRGEFLAAQKKYLDRYRRVRISPDVSIIFENRQTLWFKLHEIIHVARLIDPNRIMRELAWYNQLLPARNHLCGSLLIDASESPKWLAQLTGKCVRMIAETTSISAKLSASPPEERCFHSAAWLEFALTDACRAALADDAEVYFVVNCGDYRQRSEPLDPAVCRSLLEDVGRLDRNAA